MRKINTKIGAMLLACCLSTAAPAIIASTSTSYAAGPGQVVVRKATPTNASKDKKATPSNPDKQNKKNRSNEGSRKGSRKSGGSNSKNIKLKAVKKPETGSWIQDGKGWWYKEANGSYPKSKWMELSYNNINRWYYFDDEGYMATGWKLINGKWYYLYENTEGSTIKGAMASNTRINGYYVGGDGAWVE
jgi:putative LPXTG-motif protein cell wall anchor domain protein